MTITHSLSVHRTALALREAAAGATGGSVVLVTSARPGEGKSLMAGLLARALASHQEGQVLLVDAGLTATAERSGGAGLAGLLAGADPDGLVQAGSLPGLWHLPRGDAYHASQLFPLGPGCAPAWRPCGNALASPWLMARSWPPAAHCWPRPTAACWWSMPRARRGRR